MITTRSSSLWVFYENLVCVYRLCFSIQLAILVHYSRNCDETCSRQFHHLLIYFYLILFVIVEPGHFLNTVFLYLQFGIKHTTNRLFFFCLAAPYFCRIKWAVRGCHVLEDLQHITLTVSWRFRSLTVSNCSK